MSPRPSRVDLRAHYAAPSTRDDDAHYLAQAAAYIAFQPAQRSLMSSRPPVLGQDRAVPEVAHTPVPQYIDETQAAVLVLQSQLDNSNTGHLQSSLIVSPAHENVDHVAASTPSSKRARTSSDINGSLSVTSSHLRTPIFDRSSKRRRIDASGSVHRPVDCGLSQARPHAQGYKQAVEPVLSTKQPEPPHTSDETTSELPTTYSLSDISSDHSKNAAHSVQRSLSDPGPLTNAQLAQTSGRHRNLEENAVQDQSYADKSTESESLPVQAHDQHSDMTSSNSVSATAPVAVRQIRAPAACVGISTFKTHVTDRLRYLADSHKLRGVYTPSQVVRSLDPLERGHWCFSIASWSKPLQQNFWSFLKEFISGGASGWGIWCTWSISVSHQKKDIIKAFCWGELARHTYLLLYVASRSHIRRIGLQWIDAAGEIVVTIGGDESSKAIQIPGVN